MVLNRVVITGRGAVSPFGLGVERLVENLWAGNSAVCVMEEWRGIEGLKSCIAAPVPPFDYKSLLPRTVRRSMGKMAIYANLATMEAVRDAGIDDELLKSGKTGAAIGSTTGSPAVYEKFYARYLPNNAFEGIKSGEFFKMMGHTCTANVCLALGIRGEQWAPVSACTSSSQAVGLGYLLVQTGRQEVVLCGGSEETHASVTGVFDLLRAASYRNDDPESACRPFDTGRDGVVCGGGSGILVLENYEHAKTRGAKIYGEIVGFGNVNDAGHIANPDKDSMVRAMKNAMDEAGLRAEDIDYVNAHATGTELGDVAEAAAIGVAVDSSTPVSSFKGHLGHTLGASGTLELIGVLEMMERGEILPTRNLEDVDPRCADARLETEKRKAEIRTVLKNNFALGGVNTSLAITKVNL
ncbi:3-oxoacyl-[acyl-carrier-protein] synthase II [Desulforhopalus singaporensis]|uniref:3-oxoacyl-[acyl-carrier-protein] synthase II n=1 Tax=Desulforhopalus singaporensis TaxID=91360 RepID=A0A1H0T4H4_9BACT|nr:3-oxoacyl-[acyl-carrier-protein] synthase II [Desulforhopalus singaporensis]